MPTTRTTTVAALTVAAMAMAVPSAVAFQDHAGSFTDEDGNVHEANIEAILDAGVTDGCNPPGNTRYCPDDFVTRGQMAKFLDRAANLPDTATDYFGDDEDSVFEDAINDLAEAGVTDGCNPPDNSDYCPEQLVTRGQMAKFLVRTFDYPASDTNWFIDDEDSVFEPDINALRAAEITFGCDPPDNEDYCPTEHVTRMEMASFVARALELEHPDPTPFGNETCDPAYFPCVPTVEEVGDLDCSEVRQEYPDGVAYDSDFADAHRINQDGDARACEPAG